MNRVEAIPGERSKKAQIPIYVMNLDRSTDRLDHMTRELSRAGLAFTRFPCIDYLQFGPEQLQRQRATTLRARMNRPVSDANVGCFLTHAAIWRRIVELGQPYACVMEDDIVLAPGFGHWMVRTDWFPNDADVIKLEATNKHRVRHGTVVARYDRWQIAHCWLRASGAACYVVSQAGARKMLNRLLPIAATIDTSITAYWSNGLRLYDVLPYPARQVGFPSTVQLSSNSGDIVRSRDYHPLDWKPVVYALCVLRRWQILGIRSLDIRSIDAWDPSISIIAAK